VADVEPLIDTHTDFGARAERRLREDRIGWLVTVGQDGTPQPNAVWFVWDGTSLLVYSMPDQAKLKHIARNPRVALHLDSQDSGDDIVVVTGTAVVDMSVPLANQNPPYLQKYAAEMARLELGTPEVMAQSYSVPIRITPSKVRGF
jgi:PPOX class probable F420-dependent enzyme